MDDAVTESTPISPTSPLRRATFRESTSTSPSRGLRETSPTSPLRRRFFSKQSAALEPVSPVSPSKRSVSKTASGSETDDQALDVTFNFRLGFNQRSGLSGHEEAAKSCGFLGFCSVYCACGVAPGKDLYQSLQRC